VFIAAERGHPLERDPDRARTILKRFVPPVVLTPHGGDGGRSAAVSTSKRRWTKSLRFTK